MFEKFTERARQVVVLAQEEARALSHNYIGTEHVLLGLLREEEGLAARVLGSLGITVERVRAQVVRIVGASEEVTSGQIPFTPRAKKVLELALREALSLAHNYIGTEHILLGLVRENEGVAARILLDFDANAEKVRNETIRCLSGAEATSTVIMTDSDQAAGNLLHGWLDDLGPDFNRLMGDIRLKLGREPDAGDLLLAFACATQTIPGQALHALGVDLDALWGALEHARIDAKRVREEARAARKQFHKQTRELRAAKEQAILAQEFERAAALRDQERELLEKLLPSNTVSAMQDEALRQVRRRLGIPDTDAPPGPPKPS